MQEDMKSLVVRAVNTCKQEAQSAKIDRMNLNRDNFDCYHLKQDFSHKSQGQSTEFLAKQAMAVEQICSFMQQGLVDQKKFFSVEKKAGNVVELQIQPGDVESILVDQLGDFPAFIADSVKLGLLGSLMVVKVHGKNDPIVKYEAVNNESGVEELKRKEKDQWKLQLDLIRQEDYFPDPTGKRLYEIQHLELDYHELVEMAQKDPDNYDMQEIQSLTGAGSDTVEQQAKSRETGQNMTFENYRRKIQVDEFWGTLLNPATGEVIEKNVVCAVADERVLIKPVKKNPFWHQESPFIAAPIIRVPHSVWHKALADAGTAHNRALNEIYNLCIDAGLMSVWGIKQIRTAWLEDPSQVSNGVPPGITLKVNQSAPPNAQVLERVDTGALSQEALSMMSVTDREFQQSMLTNDTRTGAFSNKDIKATEIVASNQNITGIFNGVTKTVESSYVEKVLQKAWPVIAQNMRNIDVDTLAAVLGDRKKAAMIAGMSPEKRFADTVGNVKFSVFGLSNTLGKMNDYRKWMTLLQTIGASPLLVQEFQSGNSMAKLLVEIMKAIDIDVDKIAINEEEKQQRDAAQAQNVTMANFLAGVGNPNALSQVPSPSSNNQGGPVGSEGPKPPRSQILQGMTNPG